MCEEEKGPEHEEPAAQCPVIDITSMTSIAQGNSRSNADVKACCSLKAPAAGCQFSVLQSAAAHSNAVLWS